MAEDIDDLMGAAGFAPPAGFAQRMTALARATPQTDTRPLAIRLWQWLSLGIGAGLGALLLGEFVFFAFVTVGAQ